MSGENLFPGVDNSELLKRLVEIGAASVADKLVGDDKGQQRSLSVGQGQGPSVERIREEMFGGSFGGDPYLGGLGGFGELGGSMGMPGDYDSGYGGRSYGGMDPFAGGAAKPKKNKLSKSTRRRLIIGGAALTTAVAVAAGVMLWPKITGGESHPDVNLETMISGADLLSKKPFAVLGVQVEGETVVTYTDTNNKVQTITEYQGNKLTWALREGIEYSTYQTKSDASPLSFAKKDGRTIITVDLSKMSYGIDPTITNGQKALDGTEDSFAVNFYPQGAQIVTAENTGIWDMVNAFTTKPPPTDKDVSNMTAEDWNKVTTEVEKAQLLATTTIATIGELTVLEEFEGGKCGDPAALAEAQRAQIIAQLHESLQKLGVDPSTVDIAFTGETKNDASVEMQSDKKYGGMIKQMLILRKDMLQPVLVAKTCTVTNVVGK